MSTLKTVYYVGLIVVIVLARVTWIALTTIVLVAAWVVYNILSFDARLLFTRIPWKLKKTLIKSYNRIIFEKALELSILNMLKQVITLLSKSRSKTPPPYRGRPRRS